jgi:hypothetical protein
MAIKILGNLDVTGDMGITASDVPSLDASKISSGSFATARIPNLDASKITSGTFSTSRIPNLAASKITSGVFDSARLPTVAWTPTKYLFATAQTYTSSNTSINLQSGANMSGTTAITQSTNRLSFDESGTYLISWNINWENEVADRNNFGASAKINGTIVQGGTDIQYFRHNSYGHKSTTSTTFSVDVDAGDNLEFFTFLQHGTANHKVTSTNGDGGAITILRLS